MAMAAVPHFIKVVREHLPLTITRAVLDEFALLIGARAGHLQQARPGVLFLRLALSSAQVPAQRRGK